MQPKINFINFYNTLFKYYQQKNSIISSLNQQNNQYKLLFLNNYINTLKKFVIKEQKQEQRFKMNDQSLLKKADRYSNELFEVKYIYPASNNETKIIDPARVNGHIKTLEININNKLKTMMAKEMLKANGVLSDSQITLFNSSYDAEKVAEILGLEAILQKSLDSIDH